MDDRSKWSIEGELKARSVGELIQLSESLEALEADPTYQFLTGLVEGFHGKLNHEMIHGPARSESAYARRTGFLSGLEEPTTIIATVKDYAAKAQKEAERVAAAREAQTEEEAP